MRAQREVVEEARLFFLVSAGETEQATRILDDRLERRSSPMDERRRESMTAAPEAVMLGPGR